MAMTIHSNKQDLGHKDAVFFSPHKFVGGVDSPGTKKIMSYLSPQFECCEGILVIKKKLFKNPVPSVCGGGTVFFVSCMY